MSLVPPGNPHRQAYIDIARGLGIIAVIMGHSHAPNSEFPKLLYIWHLPLFFCLSGMLFVADRSFFDVARSKARTLLVPYLAVGMVIYGYWYFFYRFVAQDDHGPSGILHLLAIQWAYGTGVKVWQYPWLGGVGPLWFLPALFMSNTIFFAVLRVREPALRWTLAGLLTIAGIKIGRLVFLPWSLDLALVAQIFMLFGRDALPKILSFPKQVVITAAASLLVFMAWTGDFFSMDDRTFGDFMVSAFGAAAGTVIVLQFSRVLANYRFVGSVLAYIGQAAIIIMCFHTGDTGWMHLDKLLSWYPLVTKGLSLFVLVRLCGCLAIYEFLRHSPLASFLGLRKKRVILPLKPSPTI